MYLYRPDEIDRERAHHQAVIQGVMIGTSRI